MRITAAMCEPGLGLCSWWLPDGGEGEEQEEEEGGVYAGEGEEDYEGDE
jgi:hypothetical protein